MMGHKSGYGLMARLTAFMLIPGLFFAVGVYAVEADGGTSKAADTVLRNGYVYTVDDEQSVVQALAVRDGVITYVGDNAGVGAVIGPATRVVDLNGRMVMPGLQDSHIHGITIAHPQCDLEYKPLTVQAFKQRIKQCLQNSQYGTDSNDWLVVNHLYIQFVSPPGTRLTKQALDTLDTARPIVVNGVWGHAVLANSRALELAGITADTPNPGDGVIEHNNAGQPNGWLYDGAQALVRKATPAPPPTDPVRAARRGMEALIRQGVTSFQAQSKTAEVIKAFAQLREQHRLPARAHFVVDLAGRTGTQLDDLIDKLDQLRATFEVSEQIPLQVRQWRPGPQSGPRLVAEPGVSIDGVGEVFADGILQAPTQTAAVLQPYRTNTGSADEPNWVAGDNRGELYLGSKPLAELATALAENGYQIQIHAIGDRAVRAALDAIETMREAQGGAQGYWTDGDSRPLIGHAELVDPEDLGRFAQLGVVPVMSYQWAKPGPDSTDAVKPYLGPDRWRHYEPEGELAAAGAKIAYGSDYPVDPLDHWFAIEVAVLREADWGAEFPQYGDTLNPEQALTLEQAIRGMTINSAYAMHQDEVTGSLEEGKLADLLVLNQNLFKIPPDDISETEVLMTMVGGKIVYTADGFSP